ncbi:UNVERIFIED_CONTAM: hypothetical protein PYX00_010739 [Menopon gallinae]|uniref:Death-inducer obliterator 1 n=1 Tax=Menopon gallinae TaxID=328185 RepID=A0AAW2HGQ2_9NEOP
MEGCVCVRACVCVCVTHGGVMKKKKKKEESEAEESRVGMETALAAGDSSSTAKTPQTAKYPKRENRKPPAHLAEAFGPALFSTPDIIRRISTGDELPQTPSEKKNFTVGVQKNTVLSDTGKLIAKPVDANKASKAKKAEVTVKEGVNHVKAQVKAISGDGAKTGPYLLKPLKVESMPKAKVTVESIEDKNKIQIPVNSERAVIIKKSNPEIQKLIEKHQGSPMKSSLYEEDQDYSDENIEENYYLDPTQMDQSLLESFGQQNCRSEEQLLQEAILLQEQLISSNKNPEVEDKPQAIMNFDDTFTDVTEDISDIVPETIDNIQNEIASSMLLESQKQTLGKIKKAEEGSSKRVTERRASNVGEGQSEAMESVRDSPPPNGNLVVDESRPDERKRNSAKRRRSDEVSDLDSDMDDALSEASWNSEDDPDRLWCICRKPHNNRFMICCDVCEEWFHGKCVGITKTIGKQMEQDGLEWSCPNCTKKKKIDDNMKEAEKIKLLKEKMAQSIREQQLKIRESLKVKNQNAGGKEKSIKSGKSENPDLRQTKISDYSQRRLSEEETVGRKCIMCKGPVRENSIYCSDDCIRKHSQHAISQLMGDSNKKSKAESAGSSNQSEGSKASQISKKEDSRIIVMDPSSKKILVGQQAPTAANLATWLRENPSYHVVYKKSGKTGKLIMASQKVVKVQKGSGESSQKLIQLPSGQKVSVQQSEMKSTQLKLTVSPNSKQVKIVPSSVNQGKKQLFQIVSSSAGGGAAKPTGYIVRQKQQPEVIDALPIVVKTPPGKVIAKPKVQEATSPKQGATSKEATSEKGDKMQRKRREKGVRGSAGAASSKELKQSQLAKTEDGKEKEKRDNDQQIRDSVKKTLADTLKARVQECKDLEFSDEHIDGLAVSIEDKLFKHFENKTDTKYKSKYRSLVFNIKDPKNETLFRKILDNSISPKELVKLSPEELASQELARWREKENQHQLEMIKKTELEAMTIGNTYIMKSHKGEQVIESDQSEKVAAVAAEIDPNTPAQELVSALNSVSSTTQDNAEEDEKNKGNTETTLMRMKTREKEHRNSKERERKHTKRGRERSRKRSRSRSRSRSRRHRSKEKKRSRSRDRSRHRHKDRKSDKKKEKDSTDGSNSPEDRPDQKYDKNEITTSEDLQEKSERKQAMDADDADHEPSSTVNIRTPDINLEESEPVHLWKGSIVMADVAKFSGVATEVSGDCTRLATDIGDKVDIVGRIPFDTVWDYITRMKKMATKDILVIKIIPGAEEEKNSYTTLYNYLSKRSRIGVIGKTSEAVKDFYLYPLASHAPVPQVLLPLEGSGLEDERDNILLGIIVRSKNKMQRSGEHVAKGATKPATAEEEQKAPDRSYTPPLPGGDKVNKKDPRLKRKVKVHVDISRTPVCDEDDDSPYSPGDSDEDLPPLPKVSKPALPGISTNVTKLLSPVTAGQEGLQDPAEIQRKIEEMNRAIEEQTQQIQSLTSTVPKLASVVPNIPLLTGSILTPPPTASPGANVPHSMPLTSVASNRSENVELPLISSEPEERAESPARSFTPPIKIEENIPFLPEVTSKISLPSNLQEILNSIQKKSESNDATPAPVKAVEGVVKSNTPDISMAFNVLNQTKGLLTSLSTLSKEEKTEKQEESTAILSRLSDEDIIRKAKEMEMELEQEQLKTSGGQEMFPCPPQPLPPGVQDIPMIAPGGSYGFALSPSLFPAPEEKNITDADERKPMKKFKLDPKMVFENEGVPDFMSATTSMWEEKKLQKQQKNYKIDIKLTMNSIEHKNAELQSVPELPQQHKGVEEAKYDVDERVLPPRMDEKHGRGGSHDGRRRRSDDWEAKRDWKYDRRHWDDARRYNKVDYNRRHGGRRFGGGPKFRKDRFEDNRDRHLEKEWEGSIKDFEERQRRRNQEIRREELRRLRKRSDSSSN